MEDGRARLELELELHVTCIELESGIHVTYNMLVTVEM